MRKPSAKVCVDNLSHLNHLAVEIVLQDVAHR